MVNFQNQLLETMNNMKARLDKEQANHMETRMELTTKIRELEQMVTYFIVLVQYFTGLVMKWCVNTKVHNKLDAYGVEDYRVYMF